MSLSIVYITSRDRPEVDWFLASLRKCAPDKADVTQIIVVCSPPWFPNHTEDYRGFELCFTAVKPNVWQGQHRLTKQDWWAASNARNTGICLAKHDWIAFVDDRCVLVPTWYNAVEDAMKGGYAVCGSYEKRTGMKVENGIITHGGIVTGEDCRLKASPHGGKAPGHWWFGCTGALPLEWALKIGGYEEMMDSLSMEDVIFGRMLENNGYPIRFDPRMKIIEDRTPEFCGPVMKRTDKGVSPKDKSHKALEVFGPAKCTVRPGPTIRDLRRDALAGKSFPLPDGPFHDWYDGQPVSEFL